MVSISRCKQSTHVTACTFGIDMLNQIDSYWHCNTLSGSDGQELKITFSQYLASNSGSASVWCLCSAFLFGYQTVQKCSNWKWKTTRELQAMLRHVPMQDWVSCQSPRPSLYFLLCNFMLCSIEWELRNQQTYFLLRFVRNQAAAWGDGRARRWRTLPKNELANTAVSQSHLCTSLFLAENIISKSNEGVLTLKHP